MDSQGISHNIFEEIFTGSFIAQWCAFTLSDIKDLGFTSVFLGVCFVFLCLNIREMFDRVLNGVRCAIWYHLYN